MNFYGVFNLKSEQLEGMVIDTSYFNAVNLLRDKFSTLCNFFYKTFHQEIIWHEYSIIDRINPIYL